ncbi:hypothetical protein [Ottowia oryzae]|uniref:Uncharacterized protein n=1 Tax=Ottowia oryzae TaxID=2109914 RepID=A0A2S0MFT1_9BURK|nr:hypothetical protein [Ottowia oryzae]AVO34749.1 hypothetical protein C6570_11300 [Ottowia oryzae]
MKQPRDVPKALFGQLALALHRWSSRDNRLNTKPIAPLNKPFCQDAGIAGAQPSATFVKIDRDLPV